MKRINVVIIDDEPNILNSLKRLLIDEDYGIFATMNCEDALRVIEKEEVKIVVCDHLMPEIDGIKFLYSVKERNPYIIRILLTGVVDISGTEFEFNSNSDYKVVFKPWENEELLSVLREAIEEYDFIENSSPPFMSG